MFAIFGLYSSSPRLVAYQPVRCPQCAEETLAVQSRSFKVAHVFWIPAVPLGFIRVWRCSACGDLQRHLMRQQKARLAAEFMGLLAILFGAMWAFFPTADAEHALFRNMTLLLFVLAAGFAWLGQRVGKVPEAEGLTPTPLNQCVLCGGALQTGDHIRCTACGAERLG